MLELGEHVHDGKAEQSVYALISAGTQPAVHLLPDTELAKPLLSAPKKPLHFWRSNATTGEALGCSPSTLFEACCCYGMWDFSPSPGAFINFARVSLLDGVPTPCRSKS